MVVSKVEFAKAMHEINAAFEAANAAIETLSARVDALDQAKSTAKRAAPVKKTQEKT